MSSAPSCASSQTALRDDQPLTDLGLDSLMGVEIENSIESAIGVGLPPTSLMRARTIGQIATLIAGHMGGATVRALRQRQPPYLPNRRPVEEVDVDALSDEEIDRLLEGQAGSKAVLRSTPRGQSPCRS